MRVERTGAGSVSTRVRRRRHNGLYGWKSSKSQGERTREYEAMRVDPKPAPRPSASEGTGAGEGHTEVEGYYNQRDYHPAKRNPAEQAGARRSPTFDRRGNKERTRVGSVSARVKRTYEQDGDGGPSKSGGGLPTDYRTFKAPEFDPTAMDREGSVFSSYSEPVKRILREEMAGSVLATTRERDAVDVCESKGLGPGHPDFPACHHYVMEGLKEKRVISILWANMSWLDVFKWYRSTGLGTVQFFNYALGTRVGVDRDKTGL